MRTNYFLILFSCFLFSCTTAVFKPTLSDVEHAKVVYPSVNIDELNKGLTLYANKCGACHQIFVPNKISPKIWDAMMPKMKVRAKLEDEEMDLIVKYIKSKEGKSN
ncbi:MAG: hypothetical protein WCP52_02610 [Bacteroidota bacterium]